MASTVLPFSMKTHSDKATSGLVSKEELQRVVDEYVKKNLAPIINASNASPYPDIPGLPNAYDMFHLHEGGLPQQKRELAIAEVKRYHAAQKSTFMGYQFNQALDYEADFGSYVDIHVNNLGDAFAENNYTVNSKFMERAVLDYYATLWHGQAPHDDNNPDSYWGFCHAADSTGSNLISMQMARDYLAGRKVLVDVNALKIVSTIAPEGANASNPIAYLPGDSHYSFPKAAAIREIGTVHEVGLEKFPGEGPNSETGKWPADVLVSTITPEGAKSTKQISVPRLAYHTSPTPRDNPNAYTPIAFFTGDSHYSMPKATAMLGMGTFYEVGLEKFPGECPISETGEWPADVPCDESGAMDLDALAALVEFFASHGYPILVHFNYGTTFKSAYDDVALACQKLRPILEKYSLLEREVKYDETDPTKTDVRTGYWFHVDGALGAAYMPFIEMAYTGGLIQKRGPDFDFRLPMVQSIAMSGHEWMGTTMPSGIFMTRTKYQIVPPEMPEYIGTPDLTSAGSRNGISPMQMWHNIARRSYADQVEKALRLEKLATYTEVSLRHLQDEVLKEDLHVARTPLGLTVRFKRPNDELCRKYSLSIEEQDGVGYAQVSVMEHVNQELVDALVGDLAHDSAFAQQDVVAPTTDQELHVAADASAGPIEVIGSMARSVLNTANITTKVSLLPH